jgi:hypothetical protein
MFTIEKLDVLIGVGGRKTLIVRTKQNLELRVSKTIK